VRKHDHIDMQFEHGVLRYYDPRRFGALLWHDNMAGVLENHPLLVKLGLEPLDSEWDGGVLFRASRGRSVSVKQFLLAGHVVVGVGNIYCSEALFRAGIRPMCAAGKVTAKQYIALGDAIKLTLSMAVQKGGSTLKDFAGADGASGYFQQEHFVYDRAGLPCRICTASIKTLRQGQRSTFYCAKCQK
jgi:formamidopyrimidine-DNA glycosylase